MADDIHRRTHSRRRDSHRLDWLRLADPCSRLGLPYWKRIIYGLPQAVQAVVEPLQLDCVASVRRVCR